MPKALQFSSAAQSCLTLCKPMDCSMLDFPVHHQLPELAQTHVHWVGDAMQPSHPLSSPSPPAFNLSQHQGLIQWANSSHQVAKVLELQHQSFQWIFDCVDHNELWKALKEMGIPDHLTCLPRNLYAGQEATVRTLKGTSHWFKIKKGLWQGCLLSPYLLNLYTEHIMRNARLDELQIGIKIGGENINLKYAIILPEWQKAKRN